MRQAFLVFAILLSAFSGPAQAQSITIGNVETGPYGYGSSITVPITLPSDICFGVNNRFRLYLSDANGSFTSQKLIGEVQSHFATFINGTIPATSLPAGSNYKIKVFSTDPQTEVIYPGNITINAITAKTLDIQTKAVNVLVPDRIYGFCFKNQGGNSIYLENKSESMLAVTGTLKNDYDNSPATSIDFVNGEVDIPLTTAYYTASFKSVEPATNIISTRSYIILNSTFNLIYGAGEERNICYPDKLQYILAVHGAGGIESNYPGMVYGFNWGDNSSVEYKTHCEILKLEGKMEHLYNQTSCGLTQVVNGDYIFNAFATTVSFQNEFCTNVPRVTYAHVYLKPDARLEGPETGCVGSPVLFKNLTVDGSAGSGPSCTSASDFKWYVDGVRKAITKDFNYTFTAPGTYEVKLEASNLSCSASIKTQTICIYEKPQPAFTFTKTPDCNLPINVKITDQTPSTGVVSCGQASYKWEIINNDLAVPAPIIPIFVTGDATSKEPEFRFTTPGNYTIRLTVSNPIPASNSCSSSTVEKTLTIPGGLDVSMPPAKPYCRVLPITLDFGTDIDHKPTYKGAGDNPTYNWEVTGGNFEFAGTTGPTSRFPIIVFKDLGTYTVKVTYSADCSAPKSASQIITLHPAVTVNAGADASVCYSPLVAADNKYTFSGNPPAAGQQGNWSLRSGPSAVSFNGTEAFPNATASGLVPGEYVFRWTLTSSAAGCIESDTVTITVIAPPAKPLVANPTVYCLNDAASPLSAQASDGNTLLWFTSPSLTGGTATAPSPATASAGTQTYYVVQKNNLSGCLSDTSRVIVIVQPAISGNTIVSSSSSDPICYDTRPAGFTAPDPLNGGNNVFTYLWEESEDNGATWTAAKGPATSALYTPGPLKVNTMYRRTVYSGKCSSISNVVAISVLSPLVNTINTATKNICEGDAPALLQNETLAGSKAPYTIQWQSASGSVWTDIPGANDADYQPPALTTTTNFRRKVTTSCGEETLSQLVVVVVNKKALSDFKADETSGCAPFNLASANIAVTPHTNDRNGTFQWFADGIALGPPSLSYNFPGYTISDDGKTVEIKLVTTSKSGCAGDEQVIRFSTYAKIVSAGFELDKLDGCGPLDVNFNNISLPLSGVDFKWDFGNGETSTDVQPGKITFAPDPLGLDKTYTITLTVSTACDVKTFSQTITVKAPPQAIFTPSKTEGCSPLNITFTNQSRGQGATYHYYFGDGTEAFPTDASDVSHVYITDKTKTFEVKLVVTNGCDTHEYTKNIVVHPNTVVANLVVNGSELRGCAPHTVSFDNNSTGANSFYWDFGDATGVAVSSVYPETKKHTFTSPGTYVVTLRATNGCSDVSTTKTIEVFDAPQPSFTVPKLLYCVREPIAFANNSVAGIAYAWDFGDGTIKTDVNPNYAYSTSGKFTVKLTATQLVNGISCSKTAEQEIEIVPKASPVLTGNESALNCAPFNFIVSASAVHTATIEWDFGDPASTENTSVGLHAEHEFTQPGTYIVKAKAFNELGCFEIYQKQITVTASPIADFGGMPAQICGRSTVLNLVNKTVYTGSDPVIYEWYINETKVSSAKNLTNFSYIVPASVSLPHKVVVKLLAKSSVRSCSTEKYFDFQFNPVAKPSFTLAKSADCAPFKLTITNTSVDADSYSWYLDGRLVSTDKDPNNIVLKDSDKDYFLKLEVNNSYGCAESMTPVRVTTFPTPDAAIDLKTRFGCDGTFLLDASTARNSSKEVGTGSVRYSWDYGDNSFGNTEQPQHRYTLPGTYIITLTANNGTCTSVAQDTVRIYPAVEADFNVNTTKGCRRLTVSFENVSRNATKYKWDFGDGTFDYNKNPAPHTFTYHRSPYTVKMIAENEAGCSLPAQEVIITVAPPPETFFSALPGDSIKIPDYTFQFENGTNGDDKTTYFWDFGDHTTSTDKDPGRHTYKDIGKYTVKLKATNRDGCDSTFQRVVEVQNIPCYLYVPNAFEPGSEHLKIKKFIPVGQGLAKYSIRIFNRWGAMVWESNKLSREGSPMESWDGNLADGTPAMQGVYIWDISAKFLDGTEWKGMKYRTGNVSKTGSFNLIR